MSFFKKKDGSVSKKAVGGGLVTAAMVPAFAFIAMTADVQSEMTAEFEGTVLANYIDSVGVETWCTGETEVGRLESGYTKEYCEKIFTPRFNEFSTRVYSCYTEDMKRYVTPAMHGAFTDVAFNTGATCRTGMMRNLKAGKPVEACEYILQYKRAAGRDCSIRSNNCYGVWDRRLKVLEPCLKDARQIPQGGMK